jgi:hypothetical protein
MNEIALSKRELIDLTVAEEIIESHKKSFLEVGAALVAIKDGRLYRATHKTFEEYLDGRWSFKKSRAYQLMSASEDRQSLSTVVDVLELPTNERQVRELAKAPKEKQAKVAKEVAEKARQEKRKPTAKDYKEAVEDLQYDDVEDDDEEIEMPVQISAAELAVANAAIGKKIVSAIDAAKKLLRAVEEVPGTELLVSREKSIMRELDSARNSVLVTIPHSVCPRCHGKCCAQCGNMGWVNSVMADQLTA